ncbi:MAG TPA: hypothetical protein VFB12_21845 [Ktedonobacteraceae bacterium]|nr:hypothetical protein [Ktedonobacteraceae bacterium]
MQNNRTIRRWSDIYKMNVSVPSEGKTVGQVEDFYFKEGTNSISGLRVRTRLQGDLTLPVYGIESVEAESINIASEQMLLKAIPPFPLGRSLFSRKVVNAKGDVLGVVKEVMIAVDPPSAMRLAAFEIVSDTNGHSSHPKSFTADGVEAYDNGTIIVHDQIARRLR